MKQFIFILSLLFLTACGKYEVVIPDSKQSVVQSGASYSYVVIRVEFIQQIQNLCSDANPVSQYTDLDIRNQVVATCTLQNLNIFNIDPTKASGFLNQYCGPNADLTNVNPDQLIEIQKACTALGAG